MYPFNFFSRGIDAPVEEGSKQRANAQLIGTFSISGSNFWEFPFKMLCHEFTKLTNSAEHATCTGKWWRTDLSLDAAVPRAMSLSMSS